VTLFVVGNNIYHPLNTTPRYLIVDFFFGENPKAVAYSAQPLCWSGDWETSSPTTHRGAVLTDGAEIP